MTKLFGVEGLPAAKILLHTCCAPCALSPVPEFAPAGVEFDAFFYNPNIFDDAEREKRLGEVKKIAGIFGFGLSVKNGAYRDFLEFVSGFENEPEGGARCEKCFEMRLSAAFEYAAAAGYEFVATTLTTSPHKSVRLINSIGARLTEKHGRRVKFVEFDFKKNDGFRRSVELCKKHSIYRQNYCGCHFSKR